VPGVTKWTTTVKAAIAVRLPEPKCAFW
jgi:hypothetical protein